MEAVVAAVVEVGKKIFTKEFVKQVAIAIAVNAAARMLQPKSKDKSADRSSRFSKQRDSSPYRDVILGTAVTGGTFIDAIAYSTDNMFYCEIIKLADHECDGLVAAYAGGRQLTINGDGSVQEYIEGSTPRMWIYFQAGAWGETTHSEVLTAFGGRYTANDRGRGVCRVIIKCDMRSDKLFPSRSPPDLTFAVRGAKIYSPRLDTSLGGSHVWGNYATYAWTDNLADIAYNVARGIFVYGGASPERLAGGSYDSEELPLAQWAAESSACEVAVSLKAGGTERRYRGGLIFSTNEELEGILADLAAGAAGFMLDLGGTLIFQAGVARTPVATLTDADFIAGKLRRTWRQAARERFNTVTGRFTDPALRYQQNTLPIRRSTSDITADNNEERVETMSLGVVQSQTQGQRVMEIRRRSNRLNAMFQIELPPRWQHLEAGDWVTYSSARRGWTKTFVLLPAELKTTGEDMLVSALSMVEVSSNTFTWTPATDELDVINPASVGPGSIPDATIAGFTAVASANTATNESSPAIEVAWTVPSDPTIDSVAIDYKRPSAGTWLTQSFDAKLGVGQITGLAGGNWMVRARPITKPLRPGTASGIVTVTLVQIIAGEAGAGIGGAPILNSQVTGFANQAIDTEFNYFDRTWNALFASAGTWTVSKFVALGATQVLRRAASAPPAGAQFNIGQALAASLPVQEGQRLEASAIVSPTNCTAASNLQVSWFNAAGSFVGATPVANSNGDSVVGGFVTVPSGIGAAIASLTAVFIVNTGGIYTEGRFARPFLRIASADQSVLTPYTPGPVERVADQTSGNVAAGFIGQGNQSTINRFRQSTAPSSPQEGDIWEDTSTTPVSYRKRMSGAWVFQSEEGADITAQAVPSLEGPASVTFDVDAVGALSPGSQVPRTLQFIRKRGNTDVSTSTTWSIVSPVNITLGTITNGGVNITAVAAGLSNFTVQSVRDGVTIDLLVTVAKNTIAAGTISATRKTDTNSNGTLNNSSWQTIASVILTNCPTGNLYFDTSAMGVATGTGTCDHKARITIDGTLAGSELPTQNTVTGGTPAFTDFSDLFAQVLPVTAGTRTIAFQLQRTTGTGTIDISSTRFDVAAFPG